ncbi:exocyst complex component EXO70A1-like [Malus sylvestris]|uniref:exocyst complex component EXO70A1-like n=1 Tax=Malus sylvestris TaxID=3752 RepID=UPI0021AD2642|nr:exocyst complex component EXO70A1-like [Malus sylvestris]
MADVESFENLKAAQKLLKASMEQSTALSSEIDEASSRLDGMKQRLSSLEAAIRPAATQKCGYFAMRDQINGAIGTASAVLKVYDVVRELENSLSFKSCSDLPAYLSVMKRLEEALRFLAGNCGLAIQWLQDIVEFLEGDTFANDQSFLNLKKAVRILWVLRAIKGYARLDGGVLNAAFNKLETEFESLLMEKNAATCIASSPLLVPVVQKLQAIVERLNAADRLEKCILLYAEARSLNARRSLQALDLDYLEIEVSEFDDLQSIDSDQWSEHLELVVKHFLELEYKLCNNVFEKTGLDAWKRCIARFTREFRLVSFLQFGRSVTKIKKGPLKLLKLLDIFTVLENLRLNFNRLFGGEACAEIQNLTRDLIKRVVNGACEIFWELPNQVELQRWFSPPSDGSIPGLVTFITSYCNQLLGDNYRAILIQVLQIHQSWKTDIHDDDDDDLLSKQIFSTMEEIGLNLDAWSKTYEDFSLSYLFMMNNHCHFSQLKGTKLGDLMGNSWLGAHEQYKDYYATLYLRESWGKLLILLTQKCWISPPVGGATDYHQGNDDKKRLKAFNQAFDEGYKKHSNWVISDDCLRQKVCQLLVQAVVPVYSSYMQEYGILVQQDTSARKYVKYTTQSLEKMLSSLFQPQVSKHCSTKHTRFIGRLKNVVTNQFRVTLTAV